MMPWMKWVRTGGARPMVLAGLLLGGAVPLAVLAQGPGQGGPETRASGPAPRKIVSLNLCADQYLLALADRGQIAGLTRNADNPQMSAAAAQTRGLRILGQSAEEILAIDPDLVVGMPARRSAAMTALMSTSLNVVSSAALFCASLRRLAIVWRRRVIFTRS